MVSRSLLALLAFALIVASVTAAPAEDVEVDDEDFERGWIKDHAKKAATVIIKQAIEFFKNKASRVNWNCVGEVYDNCDINPVAHPQQYLRCAKNYVSEHKEHCYPKAD